MGHPVIGGSHLVYREHEEVHWISAHLTVYLINKSQADDSSPKVQGGPFPLNN